MRLLASLVTAAAVALSAVPASAWSRTVHVPVVHCRVTVEAQDVWVYANTREVRVERWGQNAVSSDC